MLVGAEAADRARRDADDSGRLLVPDALAIGPRTDIDGVLEHAGHRTVVFGRYEQHAIDGADLIAKPDPGGRWARFEVRIVKGQLSDLGDLELQLGRRELAE